MTAVRLFRRVDGGDPLHLQVFVQLAGRLRRAQAPEEGVVGRDGLHGESEVGQEGKAVG